jgi:SsrA-binding protein
MAKKGSAKPPAKSAGEGLHVVARNRKARHEFELIEKVEAGIVLQGTEVKSLRNGKASLDDSYAAVENGEVWLYGCDIPEYLQANRMNHKPKRPRKLLLNRGEINKLASRATEKGMTLVPLQIYFKRGMAKVELSVAKGRKTYDKREAIKKDEAKRDMQRFQRRG